jgi:actin-related protein
MLVRLKTGAIHTTLFRFAGLPERLDMELREGAGALKKIVQVHASAERDVTAWHGGAVLANLPHFRSMWIR